MGNQIDIGATGEPFSEYYPISLLAPDDTHDQTVEWFDITDEWLHQAISSRKKTLARTPVCLRERRMFCELTELSYHYYLRTGSEEALEDSIKSERSSLEYISTGFQKAKCMLVLGDLLHFRFRLKKAIKDMSDAIDTGKRCTYPLPPLSPDLDSDTTGPGPVVKAATSATFVSAMQDIDEAIVVSRTGFELVPADYHLRLKWLGSFASLYFHRYNLSKQIEDLDETIDVCRVALRGENWETSDTLISALLARFGATGHMSDVQDVINLCEETLSTFCGDNKKILQYLAEAFLCLYRATNNIEHLEKSIDASEKAAAIYGAYQSLDVRCQKFRGGLLYESYQRTGSLKDLDESISLAASVSKTVFTVAPKSTTTLLSVLLSDWVDSTGAARDQSQFTEALKWPGCIPLYGISRLGSLHELCERQYERYERRGRNGDLQDVVTILRQMVEMMPSPKLRSSLGQRVMDLYGEFHFPKQPEEATKIFRLLVRECEGTSDHEQYSLQLAYALCFHHERTGDIIELNEAIEIGTEIFNRMDEGNKLFPLALNNIGEILYQRCRFDKTLANIEQSIDLMQKAKVFIGAGSTTKPLSKLVECFLWKYRLTDDIEDLDLAVDLARRAVSSLPNKYPNHHCIIRHRLAISLHEHFIRTRELSDLHQAIELERQNLDPLQATRYVSHANLTSLLSELYVQTGVQEYLDESIEMGWQTRNVDGRYAQCFRGGREYIPHILDTGRIARVAEAIRSSLQSIRNDNPTRPRYLSSLALMIMEGDESHLAIHYAREALDLVSEDHLDFPWHLCCLVLTLETSFAFSDQSSEIEEMITSATKALNLSPPGDPRRPFYLTVLSLSLHWRFRKTGRSSDINHAISYGVEGLNLTHGGTLQDHNNRYLASYHLSICLQHKYLREGILSDLEQSKELRQEALNCRQRLTQEDAYFRFLEDPHEGLYSLHRGSSTSGTFELANKSRVHALLPDRLDCHPRLFILAKQYFHYYEESDREHYLAEALKFSESSLACIGDDHKEYKMRLHLVARCHEECYKRSISHDCSEEDRKGRLDHLSTAIEKFQQLTLNLSQNDPLRPDALFRLGHLYSDKLFYNYEMEDLKMAVEVHRECLKLATTRGSDRALWLRHLGCSMNVSYSVFGNDSDLHKAIQFLEEAKRERTGDSAFLNDLAPSLASAYRSKFKATKDIKDNDAAIETYHQVDRLYSSPVGQCLMLSWLGSTYLERYGVTEAPGDFERAVSSLERALTLSQKYCETSECVQILKDLAICHILKHRCCGAVEDLEVAIRHAKAALDTPLSTDFPDTTASGLLGLCYKTRFESTGDENDLLVSIDVDERDFWRYMPSSNVSESLEIAHRVLKSCKIVKDWKRGFKMAEYALEMIPQYTPRYLQLSDAQTLLANISGLASLGTAFSLEIGNRDQESLGMLEKGRGVIADLLYDLRVDFNSRRLANLNPEFKQKIMKSVDKLGNPTRAIHKVPDMLSDQRENGLAELSRRIEASRNIDDFMQSFKTRLTPGHTSFTSFTTNGPIVVINVSYRSDVFIVKNLIEVMPLPSLSQEDLEQKLLMGDFGSTRVLEWLWDSVTGPILDKLGYKTQPANGKWPQVCWITTGALSRFPLHAAGYHMDGSGRTVIDRVMSSYSSSLNAIVEGPVQNQEDPSLKAVLVGMQNTPGTASRLPHAPKELSIVRKLCKSMNLNTLEPERRTQQVLAELKGCQIFHFAGHGDTDETNPLMSQLRLEDWQTQPLTVADLLDLNLRDNPPFLAYLSACGTSRIKDKRLLDESLHLISACQLAGFRHVIGTLWEVRDETCVDVAEMVYEELKSAGMNEQSVCQGLHKALRAIRDGWTSDSCKPSHVRGMESLSLGENGTKGRDGGNTIELRSVRDILPIEDEESTRPMPWVPYVYYRSR
ncbi:TPR domain protein [Fusarium beomiforme]|uniref:TPR domain protein n=1 Tax=Fusarium beomiforme TaxID=44412 RepID=A0A9P5E254_9HYPO|nr:TPR domain protein [Fusarium beomiforme]